MGKLTDWLKKNANLIDGANLAEFEELEARETLAGVTTKEKASEFIEKTPAFKSFFDAKVTEGVKTFEANFTETKLPKIEEDLREKIKQELNPAKTEDQKQIEALLKDKAERDLRDKQREAAAKLVEKARDLGHPKPETAADYIAYGKDAEAKLTADVQTFSELVKAGVESEIKKRYGDQQPPQQSQHEPDKVMARGDFERLSPNAQMDFVKGGGILEE